MHLLLILGNILKKHQSAIKCTVALIIHLSLSVSIEISLFSIRCVYRLICSKIGDNKNVQKYTCSYKLRLCFKMWNHLNSWGSILWFMGFFAYSWWCYYMGHASVFSFRKEDNSFLICFCWECKSWGRRKGYPRIQGKSIKPPWILKIS